MALLTDHLVGRAEELGSLDQALGEVDQGTPPRSPSSGSRGSARHVSSPSSPLAPTQNGRLVLAGSASELERDLPFSVFVDALDEYLRGLESRSPGRAGRRRADGARARLPVAVCARDSERRRAPARALPQSPGGARAARAAGEDAAARSRARRLPLGRLGVRRVARRAAAPAARRGRPHRRWPSARARCRSASLPRSSGPIARGR